MQDIFTGIIEQKTRKTGVIVTCTIGLEKTCFDDASNLRRLSSNYILHLPRQLSTTSKMAPQPISRINSFQRDWSQDDGDTDVIEWEPSPPVKPKVTTAKVLQPSSVLQKPQPSSSATVAALSKPPAKPVKKPPLTKEAAEARARLIKEALEGSSSSSKPPQPRTVSGSSAKRGLNDDDSDVEIMSNGRPAKKRATDATRKGSGDSEGGKSTAKAGAPGLNIKQKLALSAEQQQILALVVDGKNVFFTGSAGELLLSSG